MRYWVLSLLLCITACAAPTLKTASGEAPDAYHITRYNIEPSAEMKAGSTLVRGTPADVAAFQATLQPSLVRALQQHTTGREVAMTITVNQIHTKTNTGLALVWGDGIQVWTNVTIWDPATNAVIGTVPVVAMSKVTAGPVGLIRDAVVADPAEKISQALAEKYLENLMKALYPKNNS